MFLAKKTIPRSSIFREFNSTQSCYASHYDVLGVTPKATQNEIKTAYYNLSKIHHPDKSKDEESAKKFRAITEAYEVLGNVNSKKMYDRGLLVGRENTSRMHYNPEQEPTDPTLKFYHSRAKRQVSHFTATGKSHIYDYDAWSANHYGTVFERSQKERQRSRRVVLKHSSRGHDDSLIYAMVLMLVAVLFIAFQDTSPHDQNLLKNDYKEPPPDISQSKSK